MGGRTALVLAEAERQQVLAERLPIWRQGAVPQARPVVVVVAGQPGAGKTKIAKT
ncbi:zeta toxin family protein [Streptomyces sp. NPDC004327]|uniref:zeta toxin family protein n=1 Tax=Streptomyces sp. NPDC004327 TaxID=3364699 RepID=UPI0036A3DEDC